MPAGRRGRAQRGNAFGSARPAWRRLLPGALGTSLLLAANGAHPGPGSPAASDSTAAPFVVRTLQLHGQTFRYAVYAPPDYTPSRAWPCVVFLHGSGECGTDGVKPTQVGLGPAIRAHPERWPCIAVVPQKPAEEAEWEEQEELVLGCLREVREAYHIDAHRIALTGISQGGHGTWVLGARHPELFSCLAPVCGYGLPSTEVRRVAPLPVWAFHGLLDEVVDPQDTQESVSALQECRREMGLVPDGASGARATLYPDLNHGCWDAAYAEPELPTWLLAQHRRP